MFIKARSFHNGPIGGNPSLYRELFLTLTIATLGFVNLLRLQLGGPEASPTNLSLFFSLTLLASAYLWLRVVGYSSLLIFLLTLGLLAGEAYLFVLGSSLYSSFYIWVGVAIVFTGLMANLKFAFVLCFLCTGAEFFLIKWNGKFGHSLGTGGPFPLFVKNYVVFLVCGEVFLVTILLVFKSLRDRMLRDLHQLRVERARTTLTAAIGEMVGKLAHELNNPLAIVDAGIIRCKTLLLRGLPNDKSPTLLWRSMDDALVRIQNVLSKIDSFSHESNPAAVRAVTVSKLLTNPSLAVEQARKKGLAFHYELPENEIGIECQPEQIEFVLSVLLDNAFDSVSDRNDPSVRLRVRKIANTLHFEVEDNGRGISDDVAERLFQPFFSTKNVNESLGMNLYVSHCIIGQHKGKIGFVRHKAGASLWFELPLPLC